jgi:hypothetical protein
MDQFSLEQNSQSFMGVWNINGEIINYYPQGNGLEESTNKTLIQVLKKIIATNQRNWHRKLIDALWES